MACLVIIHISLLTKIRGMSLAKYFLPYLSITVIFIAIVLSIVLFKISQVIEVLYYRDSIKFLFWTKRLLEMSSVAENNRIIPAIDKLDN